MHRPGFIPLSLLCLMTLAGAAPAQSVDEAVARAAGLQRAGDYRGALAAYREAAELAPERMDIHSNLAMGYLSLTEPRISKDSGASSELSRSATSAAAAST